MKVLMAPYNEDANQYQTLLYDALSSEGVDLCSLSEISPFSLIKTAISESPDIVHLHWLHPFFLTSEKSYIKSIPAAAIFLLQLFFIKITGIGVIWTAHNKINHEEDVFRADYMVRRGVAKLSNIVHVWNDEVKEDAKSYLCINSDKIEVIPHGNYFPVYPELELETYEERTYLVFGNLKPYKNIEEVVSQFIEEEVQGRLIVAGKPSSKRMEEVLKDHERNNDNIILDLGFVPKESLNKYLEQSHCVILALDDVWGSGSKLLAMTKSKLILGYNQGALNSLGEWNLIGENLSKLFSKADKLSDDEILKRGSRNKKAAKELHSWDFIGEKTKEMYKEVI